MYTQCPDCSTAFRVTADVLKQAAGKVRCGGCGNAFNALDYLSESVPQRAAPRDADAAVPELTPDPAQKSDGLPASISAEQSAALLKTLDELAGSNIRIEDTGVEWRVLDDDDVGEAAADPVANEANAEASPANDMQVDELLEESPTPVDQFLTETPPQVDAPEIFEPVDDEPSRTSVNELRFDDNTPLPDDFDLDDESLFAPAPVDEPEDDADEPADIREEAPQADFDLSEPDEWTDILGEFEDLAVAVAASEVVVAPLAAELDMLEDLDQDVVEEFDPEPEAEPVDDDDSIDEPLDMDSQFALQAEAMGIDLSSMNETLEEPEIEDDVDLELLLEGNNKQGQDIEDLLDEDLVAEVSDEDAQLDLIEVEEDEEPVEEIEEIEVIEVEEEPADEDEDEVFDVQPLTKEEQTINMQIDQDLLALAIEDEDGFASTIIIPGESAEAEALKKDKKKRKKGKKDKKDKKAEQNLKDTTAGFETIIMEGEQILSALDGEKPEKHAEAAASLAAAKASREAETAAHSGKRSVGMIIGMLALVLLITVQALHQSREALATYPAFNNVAGPLYRAIGMPLSPDWDVTGWRFEVTRHSVGEVAESEDPDSSEDVMIFSRIGNNSDKPLPYPIIGISLTDKREEPIGGFTLDPADYLANDLDPRKPVEPGDTFDAVMTIRSASAEATSFRLRACYRNADGSLRCKDDSFK
jgi:predicted Zn finger-like uncharacterized protein